MKEIKNELKKYILFKILTAKTLLLKNFWKNELSKLN